MYSANWTLPLLSAAVILLATVAIEPLQKITYGPPQTTTTNTQTPKISSKNVNLSFDSEQATISAGKQQTLAININSDTDRVTGVEIHLSFNPKVVQVTDIGPGDFLQNPTTFLKQINNDSGRVVYTIGTLTPVSGKGAVVRVKFSATKPGTTKVSLEGTQVAVAGRTSNVVNSTGVITLRVQ